MTTRQRLADAIQRAASRAVSQESAGWMLASVTATYTDGTVDITTSRGPVERVRRMKSYSAPIVGDTVKVDYNPDGNWIVIGALASS
ncbi:hypothetical protein [Streptomyces fulvorobeus]|uniref:Uncharacterized protein n=1 Tax=Streptomyces fulvorobeus TaxID=284028 RepID=A0A7J0CDZ3_9ACTN|nr:hypothetical protein [Streptomyces fulvorobeus]NYE44206.1 hypothetical protein [Streptomyces fulvorobeus]GFN00720.1 hypothetical protein Sfulv_55300 [Streptomyces fulvorobeus]